MATLAKYHATCNSTEEPEERANKELFLTEDLEEYEEGPDDGELLVVRRALSGLVAPKNQEQREAIFHTRYTIGGKVCSVIIDGGSCTDVACKTLLCNLRLPAIPYPAAYTIQWLNQGKGIQISSKCLVSLSIGKVYRDEICCDVMPMDACHVLLGRSGLFNKGVMYDGRLNTYSFIKDHMKITLTPLKPSQI